MKSLVESINKIMSKQNNQDDINAEILLTQAEMAIKAEEQDEVLAEILLNQIGGEADV